MPKHLTKEQVARRMACLEAGYTQSEVAKMDNVTQGAIHFTKIKYENSKDPDLLEMISAQKARIASTNDLKHKAVTAYAAKTSIKSAPGVEDLSLPSISEDIIQMINDIRAFHDLQVTLAERKREEAMNKLREALTPLLSM